ncbi:MAG: efflux RND transporter periplasmic adaptor subunit [Psychroflexus sp.]|nr:efflux RND transporter periplasmic adaptor subunit [Psychroflexus sp.]MDR9449219.1 efflux RND transporter periplasmic adaptor subunit [Psychroflexus sp.]
MNKVLKTMAFLLVVLLSACQNKQQQQQESPAPQLPVIPVGTKTVTTYKSYPTSLQGIVSSEIRAKVSGYINDVLVDEGERVEKGQTLFRLETQALSSDARSAQARVNSAKIEVNRLKPLVEKNIVSQVRLETAKANLAQAKSDLQSIQANIDYATIKSPVQGMVGDINLRTGALVSPTDMMPLTTVADIDQVYADFSINEKDYYNLLADTDLNRSNLANSFQKVELILPNGTTYPTKGQISSISGRVNPQTGSINFRATFNNPDLMLKDGSSGTIRIPQLYKNALVIPRLSTFERQGYILAYQFKKDSVIERQIKTQEAGRLYIVRSGLQQGDTIVAKGVNKIKNGSKVKPVAASLDSIVQSFDRVFK